MTGYQLSPRVTLHPGDRFRVSGGPYYRLASGEKIPLAARGIFTLLAVDAGRRGRVQLLAYGAGGFAVIHVAGRRKSRIPGLVCRPYRVRRAAVQKKIPAARKKHLPAAERLCRIDPTRDDTRNTRSLTMTQDRAKYLLANTLMGGDLRYAFRLGSLSHRLYDDGMTRGEYEAVRALWVTMPGSSSFYAALCEVAAGRMVCPPRLACEACGCTGQPHYFVWTGGETLCVDCG